MSIIPQQPFGFVAGRWVLSLADTPMDSDRFPDYKPLYPGSVIFNNKLSHRVTSDGAGGSIGIVKTRYEAQLNSEGEIIDAEGHRFIALPTGVYNVSFNFGQYTWPSFDFILTAEHTLEDPLWLPSESPIPSGPGVVQVVSEASRLAAEAAAASAWAAVDTPGRRGEPGPPGPPGEVTTSALNLALAGKVSGSGMSVRVDTTVGTRVFLDHPGGTIMLYGDTGWKMLPVEPEWEGAIFTARRVGNIVEMQIADGARENILNTRLGYVPAGFIPTGTIRSLFSENGSVPNKLIAIGSTVSVFGRAINTTFAATGIVYTTTNAWPTN